MVNKKNDLFALLFVLVLVCFTSSSVKGIPLRGGDDDNGKLEDDVNQHQGHGRRGLVLGARIGELANLYWNGINSFIQLVSRQSGTTPCPTVPCGPTTPVPTIATTPFPTSPAPTLFVAPTPSPTPQPSWRLGAAGETCDNVCGAAGSFCTSTGLAQMQAVDTGEKARYVAETLLGTVTCNGLSTETTGIAPLYRSSNMNCLGTGGQTPSCSISGTNDQRMCCCGSDASLCPTS